MSIFVKNKIIIIREKYNQKYFDIFALKNRIQSGLKIYKMRITQPPTPPPLYIIIIIIIRLLLN